MNKRDKKNIGIILLILLCIILDRTFIYNNFLKYQDIYLTISCIIISFFSYILYGCRKEPKSIKHKRISNVILYEIIVCFMIKYALGFAFGFLKNYYSLRIPMILMNICCPLFLIISEEIIRYTTIKANKDKKYIIVLMTILICIIEILVYFDQYSITSTVGIFKLLSQIIIPSAVKNILLTYIVYHTGVKNSIMYRIIIELSVFILPLQTNMGEYFTVIISIIFPYIVYSSVENILTERDRVDAKNRSKKIDVFDIIFIFIISIIFILVSGVFNIQILAVGSDSMEPTFKKGDAVIIVKTNNIKKDDVIAYEGKDKIVIHRIIKIEENNNKEYFHTKGDNNNAEDKYPVERKNIKGKAIIRVPYVGCPSVWINELRSDTNEQ